MPARNFKDLVVWQKAHRLVLSLYRASAGFPDDERYGLVSQLRRAAVSVPANIAEGFRRQGKADKARFLNVAEGSLAECQYYLILTTDLGYGDFSALQGDADEVDRLLTAYVRAVRASAAAE